MERVIKLKSKGYISFLPALLEQKREQFVLRWLRRDSLWFLKFWGFWLVDFFFFLNSSFLLNFNLDFFPLKRIVFTKFELLLGFC